MELRAILFPAFVAVAIISGCSKNSNSTDVSVYSDPKNVNSQEDLRYFVQSITPYSDTIIDQKKHEYSKVKLEDRDEMDLLPLNFNANPDRLGIEWTRELQMEPDLEMLEGMKLLFGTPYQFLQGYCVGQSRRLIRDFGYTVREKLVTKNGHLVADFLIDEKSCSEFDELVAYTEE